MTALIVAVLDAGDARQLARHVQGQGANARAASRCAGELEQQLDRNGSVDAAETAAWLARLCAVFARDLRAQFQPGRASRVDTARMALLEIAENEGNG